MLPFQGNKCKNSEGSPAGRLALGETAPVAAARQTITGWPPPF